MSTGSDTAAAALPRERLTAFVNVEVVAAAILALTLLALVTAQPLFMTHDAAQTDLEARYLPPGTDGHLLGTDELGRDVWSRTLEGLRWSMSAALVSTLIAFTLGTALGLIAAESASPVRAVIRQAIDTVLSFPALIAAILVIALFEQSFFTLVLTLGLLTWPVFARVVYAESLTLLERDYVRNARLIGVNRVRILLRHVLPALRPTLMVMLAFHFGDMLIAETGLSYLGLGAPLSEPTWGNMLAASRDKLIIAPWMMLVPASAIVISVVTVNLVGDGIAALSRSRGREAEL